MLYTNGILLIVITLTDYYSDGGGKGIWIRNIDELSKVGQLVIWVNSAMYTQILSAIKHYTVHAIDLLGWGRSTRDRYCGNDAVKAQSYFVDSLESWRQAMGIEKMTLLGHSFGGNVIYRITLNFIQHPSVT